jgi:sulfofructose kinase
MTLGVGGSLAYAQGEWYYSPSFDLNCLDTTGAGDVFHGAFCYAMLANMPMGAALEFSNAAAGLNCTAFGARGHVPTLQEVENLIKAWTEGRAKRHAYAHLGDTRHFFAASVEQP